MGVVVYGAEREVPVLEVDQGLVASVTICDQRLGASTKKDAMVVPAITTVATGSSRWKTQPVVEKVEGLPSLILRMKESESRKAEMKRKTSTPPDTLPNQTW